MSHWRHFLKGPKAQRPDQRAAILAKSDGRCWYCGRSVTIDAEDPQGRMCIDHIHPQSKEGQSDFCNLVPSCRSCNSSKRHWDIEEYREIVFMRRWGLNRFSAEQKAFLEEHGFSFPPIDVVFWFEGEGLTP